MISEWLETTKQFEFYASRLNLIAKVQGVDVAEKYTKNVPDYFRGELLYRTLLANCVRSGNMEKTEEVFGKMISLATRGETGGIKGMEQLVEDMKFHGLQPDTHFLTDLAWYYISKGYKDKAIAILKEIGGGNSQEFIRAHNKFFSLYASLGMANDVSRIWNHCK
ncbi:hypothetical protein JHK87_009848 [Glycine soja]|nr:hypothetical protein JHK87_009848 [Glycine soja]